MRARVLAVVLSAAAVALTACGNSPASPGNSGVNGNYGAAQPAPAAQAKDFNDADVKFAQQMIPHHTGSIEMAKLAAGKSKTPKIVELAAKTQQALPPAIEQMSGWLAKWGAQPPQTDMPGMPGMAGGGTMPGMDMGGGDMPGMMSKADMDALAKTTGKTFDAKWLKMMIEHHKAAVEMAKTEQAEGSNPAAKELAGKIATAQQAEVSTMESLAQAA